MIPETGVFSCPTCSFFLVPISWVMWCLRPFSPFSTFSFVFYHGIHFRKNKPEEMNEVPVYLDRSLYIAHPVGFAEQHFWAHSWAKPVSIVVHQLNLRTPDMSYIRKGVYNQNSSCSRLYSVFWVLHYSSDFLQLSSWKKNLTFEQHLSENVAVWEWWIVMKTKFH